MTDQKNEFHSKRQRFFLSYNQTTDEHRTMTYPFHLKPFHLKSFHLKPTLSHCFNDHLEGSLLWTIIFRDCRKMLEDGGRNTKYTSLRWPQNMHTQNMNRSYCRNPIIVRDFSDILYWISEHKRIVQSTLFGIIYTLTLY